MHVAVYGAGALGCVYGVRLAMRTGTTVSFVVRPRRVSERAPFVIARVGERTTESIEEPRRTSEIPSDADLVLLAVGTEDLEAIRPTLAASAVPIVVLTPMMPSEWRAMRDAFGDRVLAAMPDVVSYVNDEGIVRYWLAPAPTRIDEPRASSKDADVVRALARELTEAGLDGRLELGVHEINPATTVCFVPLMMGVALAGCLEALAKDAELLDLSRRGCREGAELARRIGRPEPFAPFASLVALDLPMRALVRLLGWRSPEALHYVDVHFGSKLVAQHQRMAAAMVDLAVEKGVPHEALAEIAQRLASKGM
ncbi:MAG: hypothetical protein JST00_10560 [Deltaproteobacteria bacterium]|nr:hypothetical protein [Deltaproteobacteria bacterium]